MNLKTTIINKYKEFLKKSFFKDSSAGLKKELTKIIKVLTPQEKISPDVWADRYRYITKSAIKGKWNSDYSPYLRQPSRDFIDDNVRTIVLMFSTQVGKTALLENIIGYLIHLNQCPIYVVMPDNEMIKYFHHEKLNDMFETTPLFYKEGYIKRATPGSAETNAKKVRFKGGFLSFASSNSMSALAGRSIKILILDEVDRFKENTKEGDVVSIAERRTDSFKDKKIILTSTPTDAINSRINKAYLQGDQNRYKVACPICGHKQFLIFSNLEWEKEKNPDGTTKHKIDTAYYRCDLNACRIEEGHKHNLNLSGEWVATATPTNKSIKSYHLNALYSPFIPFKDIVDSYIKAPSIPGGLKAFFNTYLAEVYDDPAEQPQYEALYERAEDYTNLIIPKDVGVLTCGADIQEKGDGRIEASVWGWGRNNKRWLIDHQVIFGSYQDKETWDKFTELRHKKYITEDGRELDILMTLVDSSAGNTTNYVYEYCRINRLDRIKAVKGSSLDKSKIVDVHKLEVDSNGNKLKHSIDLVIPNVNQLKKWLYHSINEITDNNSPYFTHIPKFVGKNWVRQLCAEKIIISGVKEKFVKTYANEALDCAVYAQAAAILIRIDSTNWDLLFKKQGIINTKEEIEPTIKNYVEIEILKKVQINKKTYEPGDIVEIEESKIDIYCSGSSPFAHRTDTIIKSKIEVVKEEKQQQYLKNRKNKANRKSWFSS